MLIFWTIVLFLLGAIVGSFLNVCIYRLPRDKAPWRPQRSYCPHCHELIAWYDNIPLVSWFLLGAQCRQCGSYISPRYILVEFLTAALFALSFWVLNGRDEALPVTAVYLALMSLLIAASFIDLELRIIPDSLTLGVAVLAPVVSVLVPWLHSNPPFGRAYVFFDDNVLGPLCASLVGMAVGALPVWLSGVLGKMLFKREAMGFGDVKFMAMIGGFLGWKLVLVTFFLAPFFGLIIGVIQLIRTKDHHIPYGPFLSMAAIIAMLWGDRIFIATGISRLF